MHLIELLSPAKDLECGIAAINHGADAVYIGAPLFGARSAAGNSVADIEKLCNYAHLFHAKVHVALNTILTDNELEQARKIIFQLYNAGIDALIIQDTGILQIDIPPIALHASTQMDNRTPEKVLFWQNIGFERVILARELSLSQIAEIRQHTSVELEAFVHGALCVSYSGQCYMSQLLTGRSANRGACAQLCRLPYDLKDATGKILKNQSHLLSLKDMNRADYLPELIQVGISSFKIEGRLKNTDYVKNITAFYRQKIDRFLSENPQYMAVSDGKTSFSFTPNPQKTFYRGETDYFLHQRENVMVHPDTPKSVGEPVGKVQTIQGNTLTLQTSISLHNGDGLCFLNTENELVGFRINKVENQTITTLEPIHDLTVGTDIYRNYDIDFDKKLQGNSSNRKVAVNVRFSETAAGFVLSLNDGKIQIDYPIDNKKEISQKGAIATENLRNNLAKLGNTPFTVNQITIDLTNHYFFPVSQINEWRRQAVEKLMAARIETARPRSGKILARTHIPFPDIPDYTSTYRTNILNESAKEFYKSHGIEETAPAFEAEEAQNATLMTCKHCIKYTLGFCTKMAHNEPHPFVEPLFLQTRNTLFQLDFDCKNCEMKIRRKP